MPSPPPFSNSASVYHPGPRNHASRSFGTAIFAGTGGQASSIEKMDARVTMMPPILFDNPLMTNPAVDEMQTIPVALPMSGGLVISSGSLPATSRDGGRMKEEATTGAYDGGPERAARGAQARRSRATPTATGRLRGPILAVDPEDNVTRLKTRLIEGGATVEAVGLCDDVFKDGVTREALERRLTHSQCRKLGLRDGKMFQIFLEKVEVMGGTKHRCRLCPKNDAMLYKNHRDALRHFLKEHFGFSFDCVYW